MASKAESEVESSPGVLRKLLNIGRGPHSYKEVTAGTPPESGQAFPTFPQAPANHTLLQVRRNPFLAACNNALPR